MLIAQLSWLKVPYCLIASIMDQAPYSILCYYIISSRTLGMNSNKIAKYFLVLEKYFLFVGEKLLISPLSA